MATLNRKKVDSSKVPTEVKEYYKSEHRDRVGLAWLIAFMTLLWTTAAVFVLFFGGRWAYRKLVHNNTPSQTVTNLPNTPTAPSQPVANKTTTKPSSSKPKTTPKSAAAKQPKELVNTGPSGPNY